MYRAIYEHWPDPITIAAVAVAAGTTVQAFGQYKEGEAASAEAKGQQAMSEYNAKLAEREAQAAEARTGVASQRQAEEAERIRGSLEAGLGASGTVSSVGTPLMIQARQAAESELDNLMIGHQGLTDAARLRSQGALDLMQSKIYGQKAKSAKAAGMIGAGGTLLTGFGSAAGLGYFGSLKAKPPTGGFAAGPHVL